MKATELLSQTAAVLAQRGERNGYDKREERSMNDICSLFEVKTGVALTEEQGWDFMICLKEIRLQRQIANHGDIEDTLKDLLGYTALRAECLLGK